MSGRDSERAVPRADTVLSDARVQAAVGRLGDRIVKGAVHAAQARVHNGEIAAGGVVDEVLRTLPATAASLRPVLNATGVVLHTNLGRAPLSAAALEAIAASAGYVDVEYDLATGRRAARGRGAVVALLDAVPSAEDAIVVNNGAAALALVATALASGREILISRGELVEIGDGFRIPELLEATGAQLREIGTTNRTRRDDYATAIGERTAIILKVHPSNFAIRGFTASVPVRSLAELGVPVVADVGSGLLSADPGLPGEPDVESWLREGAHVVTSSGDKLLGGPQAGLIFGRAEFIARLRRHPLYRALRVDKLTLAALEATVRGPAPPVRRALAADPAELRRRAAVLSDELRGYGVSAQVVPSDGLVGGGGAPELRLPGWAVALPMGYAAALRSVEPPVAARVEDARCLLDLRCVPAADDASLVAAVVAAHSLVPGSC